MISKSRVKITVCGIDYNVISSESIEYVRSVGKNVDDIIHKIMTQNPRMSTTDAAILTSVSLADDLKKSIESADNMRIQIKEYVDENSNLRQELGKEKIESDRLRMEVDRLKKILNNRK